MGLQAQLVSMGYSSEQARQAVAAGPQAIAALKASPPRGDEIQMHAALQMGFNRLQIAAALDECSGDQGRALELLVSGWAPSLQTFRGEGAASTTAAARASETAGEIPSNAPPPKCCSL